MVTSKDEMKELIRKMAETEASVEWFRVRNHELQKTLQSISLNGANYDGVGGRTGPGDPVGRQVLDREEMAEEMQINSRIIKERLSYYANLSAVMGEVLTEDERKVIWEKHGNRLTWDRVARSVRMSSSNCRRIEHDGMKKLCKAWDKWRMNPENALKYGK